MNNETEKPNEELNLFKDLIKEKRPPDYLLEDVIRSLKKADLLNPKIAISPPNRRIYQPLLGFAALILIFALGVLTGTIWFSTKEVTIVKKMPKFLFLIRATQETKSITSDLSMQRTKEYTDWAIKTQQEGFLLDGEKLKEQTRFLTIIGNLPKVSIYQTAPETDSVQGYFLIQARDFEEAEIIAKSCPHIKYGGLIEIREIKQF